MLRVKIPGGRLTAAQARLIGEIADEHARGPEPHPFWGDGYLDLTTRQDIQLHWIRIGAVPEIWRQLEAVGITTVQACGDSARNVLCCPVSGIDGDGGHRRLPDRGGYQRFLHRQPGVREPAAQVQDECHRLPRGLRPGGDQRSGPGPRPARRRQGRVQPAGRRWALRWTATRVRRRRLRASRAMRSRSVARSPSSSTSSATATTAGPAACAIWCRSWGRRRSGPSWRRERAFHSRQPGSTSPTATAAITSGFTRSARRGSPTSGSTSRSAA